MDRVKTIVNDAEYKNFLRLIAEAEAKRLYCKHDYHHALSVARLAYLLAWETGVDAPLSLKPLIYSAGLLHDVGRWVEYSSGEDHAIVSARLSEPVLHRAGFGEREVGMIITGIRQHRQPGESWLGSLLAKADDLSRECYRCNSQATCYKSEQMLKLHSSLML